MSARELCLTESDVRARVAGEVGHLHQVIRGLEEQNRKLLEKLAEAHNLRPVVLELKQEVADNVKRQIAAQFAKTVAEHLLASDPEFVECAACVAKMGSPVLCASCMKNRAAMARMRDQLAELRKLSVPPDWTPTRENINSLPTPLRKYVHDLETLCDPAGIARENVVARDTIAALQREIEELRRGWHYKDKTT